MASYKVLLKPSAERDIRKLPKTAVGRIISAIEILKVTPRSPKSVKLSSAENLYRLRVGDYRIVYEIDDTIKRVAIHYIRHRKEVYRKS